MSKMKRALAMLLCIAIIQSNINTTTIYASALEEDSIGKESAVSEEYIVETVESSETIRDPEATKNMTTDGTEQEPGDHTAAAYMAGIPYASVDGIYQYDVSIPHVVINQVYGGKSGANVSHSFIELYNPTDRDVDLSTWSLQYRSSQEGQKSDSWTMHALSGTIKPHHSYLVRCGSTTKPVDGYLDLTDFDEEWDLQIYNKGISVVLLASQTQISATDDVFDNEVKQPVIDGYVDMFAVSGNDEKDSQKALYYETAASAVQSKKKTIRRIAFQDTDNNSIEGDFEEVDYSFVNADYIAWISPRSGRDGAWDEESNVRPTFAVTFEYNGGTIPAEGIQYTYELGMAIAEPEEPVRAGGYCFVGWYEDEGFTVKYDFAKLPTGDLKLYAKWREEGAEEETFPTVYIMTVDGNGNSLQKSTGYVSATIRIGAEINADGKVKVRGNSTAYAEKKPYAIKFTNKQDVFGMGAAKKWVLLANCFDSTLLRNYLALSMAQELRLDYTPEMQYVDLYLDGVYKGNYLLTEAVESGKERVDIDVDEGDFLLEVEAGRYEEDVTYLTSPIFHYRFAMKEPETPTDEEKARVQNRLFTIENAMASGDFSQVARQVDVDSFVDFYILNEYMKTVDVGFSSVFFYFKNGRLYAGPVWDYDLATGNANPDYYIAYYPEGESYKGIWAQAHWLGEMTKYSEFMQLVEYRYRSLQPYIQYIYAGNGFLDMSYAAHKGSFERNYTDAGWNVSNQYGAYSRQPDDTYEENYEYLRDWLRNRNEWLCEYWNVESAVLDYAGYWRAVAQTQGYSALCYENYDALEAALAVDVYREDITQDEINAATQDILNAIENLREILTYKTGMPYREENGIYQYDVETPHIVINQVYGGANKASYASHSFIELYNPTDEDVDLSTWSVQYRSSVSDLTASEAWKVHKLSGTIKAHHSYLICCGSVKDPVEGAIALTAYDEVWEQPLHNKGLSVVLLASQTQIDASSVVFDNESKQPVVAGYIDLFAISGNDELDTQKALYYETAVSDVQSKKKTLRRVAFADTDNNSMEGDFEVIDYSFANLDYLAWISPRCSADGAWDETTNMRPTFTVTYESNGGSAVEEGIYQLGTAVCEPQPPVREWHAFEGWYRDVDLTIRYDFSEMPTENITLYAKWIRTEKEAVAISGIVIQDGIYTGREIAYSGTPVVTLQQDESVTVSDVPLTYSYRGIRADQSDYFSDKAPVDAGEYTLTVAVSEEDERYAGSTEYAFRIIPKILQLTVQDQTIVAGDSLPESYDYLLEGLIEGDELTGEPSFMCGVTDTSEAGTYTIEPYGAFAGMNYEIVYNSGTLTIAEKICPTFTVTYESNGGSVVEEEIYQLGTPICEPQPPVREWHAFEGWYRDADLTIRYDFSEMPTENITLYAKWTRTKKVVAISGIVIQGGIYTGREIVYSGTPVVTLQQDESITVSDVPLAYSYRGTRADQGDYFSNEAPVDAGEYTLTVAVSEADEFYTGSTEYAFEIIPQVLQLTVQDQTIVAGDSLPESYDYSLEGLIEGDELTQGPSFMCGVTDTSEAGTYTIEPYGAFAGMNYEIAYNSGTLTIVEKIPGTDASDNELVIQKIPDQIYTGSAIKPSVEVCSADGSLLKAGKDYAVKYFNNVSADTADEASQGGSNATGEEGVEGFTKELAYVRIDGKGNYQGTVYQNFHINRAEIADAHKNPADGFTLGYRNQLTRSDSRAQKPFTSLKYRKSMRVGTDYMVKLTALTAYSESNALISGEIVGQSKDQTIPAIPKGYHGSFLLTIEGIGNYTGTIEKIIYIAEKNSIMKNAVITLGKNQKSVSYRQGEAVTLTPGYYDMQAKEYYAVDAAGVLKSEAEKKRDNLFTVKLGNKYLIYGEDYTVTYAGNSVAGNATMTIEGIQEKGYCGSKSVIFRITGTSFTAKNISVDSTTFHTKLPYTGKSLTQDQVLLTDVTADGKTLVCGTDYTISYRNNLKRGTAAMIFTAEPASGYTGSFTKTFQITKAPLEADMVTVTDPSKDRIVAENGSITLTGEVAYAKGGARPSERIQLVNQEGMVLQEGTDYTISYTDNKAVTTKDTVKRPCMVIKGKGNYSGILKVSFEIIAASMEDNGNLTFTAVQMAYDSKREGDSGYEYRPKVRITDGKQVLSATKDYQIYYGNCRQDEVKRYLEALTSGNATEEELAAQSPYALVTARDGSGYTTERGVVIPLTVYETRLTEQNIYVVISEDPKQTTYTGSQLRPEISVYYGDAAAVRAAKKAKETDAAVLTDETGKYKLHRLQQREGNELCSASDSMMGDYTLAYGTNVTAGRNKGSVVIRGVGRYGGSVKVRFSIGSKRIYSGKG